MGKSRTIPWCLQSHRYVNHKNQRGNKSKHILRCFVLKIHNSLIFFIFGSQWWLENLTLGDFTKSLREWLPTCVFSISVREPQQWQNRSPVTTLWKFIPTHKIGEWMKWESIPPFITPAPEDEFGGRKSFPAAMPQQWRQKPHLATVFSGKTGDDLVLQIPSMEKCPSTYEQNNPVQQLAAKALQQHGFGKGCKGLPQPRPPG